MLEKEGELAAVPDTVEVAVHLVIFTAWSAAFLTFCEVLEPVSGSALRLLMLFDMPWQLGCDVSNEVAPRPQAMVMSPHPELAVLVRT